MYISSFLVLLSFALFCGVEAFIPSHATSSTKSFQHSPIPELDLAHSRLMALSAYKNSKAAKPTKSKAVNKKTAAKDNGEDTVGVFSKPGNLIILPFVAIFGLDLVLNILVVVKRSIEVSLTGQYTCTGPWC